MAIYFLVIAIPGIAAALYGEWIFWTFLRVPDSPDDPDAINEPRLVMTAFGLAVLLILGAALLPGHYCQVFRPSSVPRWFWPLCGAYNLLLLFLYGGYFFGAGLPPRMDGTILSFLAAFFAPPLLGLGLSLACAVKGRRS